MEQLDLKCKIPASSLGMLFEEYQDSIAYDDYVTPYQLTRKNLIKALEQVNKYGVEIDL